MYKGPLWWWGAFLDKCKTCARARPFELQTLGNDFYMPEHTKPLFRENKNVSIKKLYTFHCLKETCTRFLNSGIPGHYLTTQYIRAKAYLANIEVSHKTFHWQVTGQPTFRTQLHPN